MEAGHYDSMVYLRLWKGDLTGALQLATEKGQLTDHLLSLAPMGKRSVFPYGCGFCSHRVTEVLALKLETFPVLVLVPVSVP